VSPITPVPTLGFPRGRRIALPVHVVRIPFIHRAQYLNYSDYRIVRALS
jgi:hypothetical protein